MRLVKRFGQRLVVSSGLVIGGLGLATALGDPTRLQWCGSSTRATAPSRVTRWGCR